MYDPTEYGDRLLLGLTGMMSEAELHVLKGRMHQGKLNKARRGELIAAVPIGYLKNASGEVTLDPDEHARSVVELIFDQFDRRGTVHGVLRYLIEHEVRLPVRSQAGPSRGQLQWRPPGRETLRLILRHPIYAGAYRYGHRPVDPRRQTPGRRSSGRSGGLAAEDCLVFLKDRMPAYITWDRFEANQKRLEANRSRSDAAGSVRRGSALLAGLVWCGRCGRRMYVRYGSRSNQPAYICSQQRSDRGLPLCQSASAASIEGWLAEELLAALEPAALDASLAAVSEVEGQRRVMTQQWEHRRERARFEAERAARQYHACEPENRLVARTLERRWDEALREQDRLGEEFARFQRTQPRPLDAADQDQIRRLAAEVPALWHAATTTSADRREVVRLLVERIVLTVDPTDAKVAVRVEWAGGAIRERVLPRAVQGYECQKDWPRLTARLGELHASGLTPAAIAATLNEEGFVAPKRATRLSAGMVRRLLDRLGLRRRVSRCPASPGLLAAGEWWLQDLARHLELSPYTLHGWRRHGWLDARQLGGRGGPWAVWANDQEISRLVQLKTCPRLWSTLDQVAALRVPTSRS